MVKLDLVYKLLFLFYSIEISTFFPKSLVLLMADTKNLHLLFRLKEDANLLLLNQCVGMINRGSRSEVVYKKGCS